MERIYVFGASGSGTTTLAALVAARRALPHVDCDDHYWMPTDPPFSVKRSPEDRVVSMQAALGDGGWVLSGACNGWAEAILCQATLIVFVEVPTAERLARLTAREAARFGDRINPGGDMHEINRGFMAWAAGYDNPGFQGRNRAAHDRWLAERADRVCALDGRQSPEAMVAAVEAALSRPPAR